jgi:hypothetical protein
MREKINYSELSRRAGVDRATVTRWMKRRRDTEEIKCSAPDGAPGHALFVWADHEQILEFISYHVQRKRMFSHLGNNSRKKHKI